LLNVFIERFPHRSCHDTCSLELCSKIGNTIEVNILRILYDQFFGKNFNAIGITKLKKLYWSKHLDKITIRKLRVNLDSLVSTSLVIRAKQTHSIRYFINPAIFSKYSVFRIKKWCPIGINALFLNVIDFLKENNGCTIREIAIAVSTHYKVLYEILIDMKIVGLITRITKESGSLGIYLNYGHPLVNRSFT